MHWEQVDLLSLLAPTTCILDPVWQSKREGPQWHRTTCIYANHLTISGSLLSTMMGCCCDKDREELESLPPTLISCSSSRIGDRALILLAGGMARPLKSAFLSLGNDWVWDSLNNQCSARVISLPVRCLVLRSGEGLPCLIRLQNLRHQAAMARVT